MSSGPSKIAEATVAVFVPPACREEVLGDLHQRYRSPGQYALDATRTVPLVIMSRIRRTANRQVLLMQAFALYESFLAAAWFEDRAFLSEQWGLPRLAIPAAMALLGSILEDTYARPGRRSGLQLARGPVFGVIFAIASQGLLRIGNPDLALPIWVTYYGCAFSLVLSSAVRMLFPPPADRLQGINVPADWLKPSSTSSSAGTGTGGVPRTRLLTLLLVVLLLVYVVWKRG